MNCWKSGNQEIRSIEVNGAAERLARRQADRRRIGHPVTDDNALDGPVFHRRDDCFGGRDPFIRGSDRDNPALRKEASDGGLASCGDSIF